MDGESREFLVGLFREAYEGNWRGEGTFFVDNRPGAGLLATLDLLDADEASKTILPGTSSVAGHAIHLGVALSTTRQELDGGSPQVDWEGTWAIQRLDEAGWARARATLREEYEGLLARFRERPWEPKLTEALAYSTAHTAWHLGAVRQLLGTRVERQG